MGDCVTKDSSLFGAFCFCFRTDSLITNLTSERIFSVNCFETCLYSLRMFLLKSLF